jgi:hypothetical protein
MKYKILYVILVVAAFMGVQGFAAEVTNIELSYLNGSTVAKVCVDGTIRFTHQTEEAKDGKPFRVIVDVLSATHELGAKNFMRLPECSIEKLRTSQFSTSPEKIVRLVFDMKKETFYSITSDERTISLTFPDKSGQSFTTWSSRSVVEAMKTERADAPKLANVSDTAIAPAPEKTPTTSAKTAGAMNQSIEKDRQVSLATAAPKVATSTSKPAEAKPAATSEEQRAKVPYDSRNTYGPDYDPEVFASAAPVQVKQVAKADDAAKDAVTTATPEINQSAPALTEPKVARVDVEKEPAITSTPSVPGSKTVPTKPEAMPSIEKSNPAVEPEVAKTPVMAKAESDPGTTPTQKPAPAQILKPENKSATESAETTTVAAKPEKESESSTSRFRRSAASRNVQGTLVAEFPKRLVIRYQSGSARDPFETLVNETRVNNSVVERSEPNVEGLKLVGVIESADGDNRALFEDKSGYGYILKSGDKVRMGYVLRVESNRVYFQIFEYGWSRTVALNLDEN